MADGTATIEFAKKLFGSEPKTMGEALDRAEAFVELIKGPVDQEVENRATAQGKLKSLIERIERLEEDKRAVLEDIKEVFSEAKGEGFDVKIIRKVIKLRAQDSAKRQEEEALIDLYISAIGGL